MPLVQATIEASTPVPQSFDQAVTWACSACLRAAEEGGERLGTVGCLLRGSGYLGYVDSNQGYNLYKCYMSPN